MGQSSRRALTLVDGEQHFTCQSCGRCCTRLTVAVSAAEAESYRRANVGRWFREWPEGPEGSEQDPFQLVPGGVAIRKRADGACGFLSPQRRCRLHEELGEERKPLACRVFPFRIPLAAEAAVTASAGCPTVVRNEGRPLSEQAAEIARLRARWQGERPGAAPAVEFVAGLPVSRATVDVLRDGLRRLLDRPGPDGPPELRGNVLRIAHLLEDLTRRRVVKLGEERFAEYVALTVPHAAAATAAAPPRAAALLARLFRRGLVLLVTSVRLQVDERDASPWRLRLLLLGAALHLHGLGPRVAGLDVRAARGVALDVRDPVLRERLHGALRSSIVGLGGGERPIVEELSVAIALLNVACLRSAQRAGQDGRRAVAEPDLVAGLLEAGDLAHVAPGSLAGRLLATFAAGPESLFLFADA
jgi:Fe-S-cluster containining protein